MKAAPRKKISDKVKLAAALLTIRTLDEATGELVPVISYAEAKMMTADQIIARFDFDHGIYHAFDGPDEPWNLTPRPRPEHRDKTAKVDVPAIAKTKRIAPQVVRHKAIMDAKAGLGERPFEPRKAKGRKLQSRNNLKRPKREKETA